MKRRALILYFKDSAGFLFPPLCFQTGPDWCYNSMTCFNARCVWDDAEKGDWTFSFQICMAGLTWANWKLIFFAILVFSQISPMIWFIAWLYKYFPDVADLAVGRSNGNHHHQAALKADESDNTATAESQLLVSTKKKKGRCDIMMLTDHENVP